MDNPAKPPDVPEDVDAHADCQRQLAELEAKWKRALADYENREKDIARERSEFARYCTADVMRDFLPIVDAISAGGAAEAFRPPPDGDPFDSPAARSGQALKVAATSPDLSSLYRLCQDFLKRHGVVPIGVVGDRVDYLLHEVVGTRVEPEKAPSVILEVVQVGYTMHGRLLRPAKVIIQGEMTDGR